MGITSGAAARHTGRTVSTTLLMNVCQPDLPDLTFVAASSISWARLAAPGRPVIPWVVAVEKRAACCRLPTRANDLVASIYSEVCRSGRSRGPSFCRINRLSSALA